MSYNTQIPGAELIPMLDISDDPPDGDVGFNFSEMPDTTRPSIYIVTAVISDAASTIYMWGQRAVGAADNVSDDQWGLFNDKYGTIKLGVLGTTIPTGTHHWIIEDLGVFRAIYFQKSAGNVNVYVQPIHYGR